MTAERLIDLSHPDEIEIRRLSAASQAEADDIRAEFERRGFAVVVKETTGDHVPGFYHADIFAEKRTVPSETELTARRRARIREEKARRWGYRLLWVGLGIGLVLILTALAFFLGPLIWAILKLD